ncbi:MAG: PA2779 family protein [Limnobacter sp.]
MTEEEAQKLAAHIENAPAGAGIVGVLFTVFIILLVTDILGLTKVFPFTRSVR